MTIESVEQPAKLDLRGADQPRDPGHGPSSAAIDGCFEQLSQLAQSERSEVEFYEQLLAGVIDVLPAVGGSAWQLHPAAPARLIRELRFPPPLMDCPRPYPADARETSRVDAAASPPYARATARNSAGNPYPWPVVRAWIPTDPLGVALVELALETNASLEMQLRAAQLLEVVAEIAADFHRRRELALLRSRHAQSTQLGDFVTGLHAHLDLTATAYSLVHEGQRWIGCDRVCVMRLRRGRAITLAVSGAPHVDRRSGQIATLEHLAAAVAAGGESLVWQEGRADDLPPELSALLQAYLDRGHARQLVAIPLSSGHDNRDAADVAAPERRLAHGLLLVEAFAAEIPLERLVERASEFSRWGQVALGNALEHHAIPFLSLQTRLASAAGVLTRRPLTAALVVLSLVAVVVALAVVPADFTVQVEGTLQPQVRRHSFAPSDGVVENVRVDHGDWVSAGDPLLRVRNPALDLDLSRLTGDLQTAESKLAAVRAARSRTDHTADAAEQDRLASEEQQLVLQIEGLGNQLTVTQAFHDELNVASPLEGIVLTWNTHQLLDDRPVKQGQLLLTVADPRGPWALELRVPDRAAGHILAGGGESESDLPVTYLLASDPAITHHGRLTHLALATDTVGGRPAADALVALNGPLPHDARAGTHVTARIHCGERSLGYVWLHDLIDFVRTSLPF
jgi:hypothetical protein